MRSSLRARSSCSPGWPCVGHRDPPVRSNVFTAAAPRWWSARHRTGSGPPPRAAHRRREPMSCAGRSNIASSRSSDTRHAHRAWCPPPRAPRATMTVCTPASVSRAAEVGVRNSDSGVVIRMSGGGDQLPGAWRHGADPDADLRRLLAAAFGDAGDAGQQWRRLRSTSTASALSGDTYSARRGFGGVWPDRRSTGTPRGSSRTRSARPARRRWHSTPRPAPAWAQAERAGEPLASTR